MSTKSVVHCKKDKFNVYIGRPSKWGNPFVVGKDGSREDVIKKYGIWLKGQDHLIKDIKELKGKILGCWCAPQACHGDILTNLANSDYTINCPQCNSLVGILWNNYEGGKCFGCNLEYYYHDRPNADYSDSYTEICWDLD